MNFYFLAFFLMEKLLLHLKQKKAPQLIKIKQIWVNKTILKNEMKEASNRRLKVQIIFPV